MTLNFHLGFSAGHSTWYVAGVQEPELAPHADSAGPQAKTLAREVLGAPSGWRTISPEGICTETTSLSRRSGPVGAVRPLPSGRTTLSLWALWIPTFTSRRASAPT